MADEFRTFDKVPIVGEIRISRWTFGLREVILALIAALLLLLCLVFAGLFGRANDQLANEPSASAIVGDSYCTSLGCMETAARAVSFMNKSVDPCDNFYQYACGYYPKMRRVSPNEGGRNVITDLRDKNENRIIDVIEQPIDALHDWAAERKLKQFFDSCNDMYMREKQRGIPFLTKVVPNLGGWKLLGTWNPDSWDLNTVLSKVQSDYWVDALFAPRVRMEHEKGESRIITLDAAGTGKWMRYWMYLNPWYESVQKDYKTFIRRVASLLFRDAQTLLQPPQGNDTNLDDLLDEFVNDTYTIEHQIAVLDSQSLGLPDWMVGMWEKLSLSALTSDTNGVIDWTTQLSYLFNTAGVSGSTEVIVYHHNYFIDLSDYLQSLPQEDMKRMMHNYLIWRVAEVYVQELSWEYIHANREVFVDLHGYANFMGVYRYCFALTAYYMDDALDHLYITQFLSKKNKDTAGEIADNIRQALKEQLSKTPWMDEPTKKYASQKLDVVSIKMGYPDWMANQGAIDDMYSSLSVNVSDFFDNILRMNQLRRAQWNAELRRRGTQHEEWIHAVYDTTITVDLYWNEVAAPAGMLQFPIYDADQPHFSTFGSLGSLLGMFLHRFVDDYGKGFDKEGEPIYKEGKNGVESGSWWSNASLANYKIIKGCVQEVYSNLSQTVMFPDGTWETVRLNASYLFSHAIDWTNGMRLALLGYQDWAKANGLSERMIPGLDMNYDQMIFLGHAQTLCEAEDPYWTYLNALYGVMNSEMTINMALGQMEEFSNAFKCSENSKMNHKKKCDYY